MIKKLMRYKHVFLILAIIAVASLLLVVCSHILINGFSFSQNSDFVVTIDSPLNGDTIYGPDYYFTIEGRSFGKTLDKVYIWDANYNVGVLAGVSPSRYAKSLYAGDFSNGRHTLCVQAIGTDGSVSQIATVTIYIDNGGTGGANNAYLSDSLPAPFSYVFRPVEDVVRQTIVFISGGTNSDDLNGNNVPDVFEQSPIAPTYNPINVPVTFIFVIVALVVVILIIVIVIRDMLANYVTKRAEIEKAVLRNKKAMEYRLKLAELEAKKAKLISEGANAKEIARLQAQIKALKNRQPPVQIFLGKGKIKNISKEEK